ncbi:facilitated trehalose transporter Tret1-like isoform X2 [Plodia interpunctella]|nr:facilitated trehalose transporter Tret1-like isoform X2 [Plodia interpunctella]XP_053607688.1 facilitated trehalose transporter Tret1-like isoform X2 [Plodia interpunctella]
MQRGNRKIQYLIVSAVSLATVTMGVSSAWPTPAILKFHNNETDVRISEGQISWMLALAAPGFLLGSLVAGLVCERFGRRSCLVFSAPPIAVGTVIVAVSVNVWLLYLTRILWGLGTGMISTIANMYIAEIADKEIRGELSIATKFMFNFGNLIVMVVGHYVSYSTLNYMMLVLPLGYFLACCFIPETPYFYLKEGKVEDAKRVLMVLRKYDDEEGLYKDLSSLQADVKNEMRRSGSLVELFTGKQYRKAIYISIGLKLALILTGGITTRNYLGRIMQEGNWTLGLDFVMIVFGAISFIVGIMSSILSDKLGRRPLLIYSFLGTGISLALVAAYFFCQEVLVVPLVTLRRYSWIPFVGIISSTVISTLGFNSLAFLIPAETFPLNVKSTALTSLNVFSGMLGFAVAKGYQEVKDVSGLFGVFTVFGGVAIAGTIFSYFYVPETKGKSLKEIQQLLQGDLYERNSIEKLNQIVVKDADEDCDDGTELKEMIKKI